MDFLGQVSICYGALGKYRIYLKISRLIFLSKDYFCSLFSNRLIFESFLKVSCKSWFCSKTMLVISTPRRLLSSISKFLAAALIEQPFSFKWLSISCLNLAKKYLRKGIITSVLFWHAHTLTHDKIEPYQSAIARNSIKVRLIFKGRLFFWRHNKSLGLFWIILGLYCIRLILKGLLIFGKIMISGKY